MEALDVDRISGSILDWAPQTDDFCRAVAVLGDKVRDAEGQVQSWPVSGGFFEISKSVATVLADRVEADTRK